MASLDSETEQVLRNIIQGLSLEELIRYHQDYEEPVFPEVRSSEEYPEDWEFFAAVADGVVKFVYPFHKTLATDEVEAFSCSPTIIKLLDSQKNLVGINWSHNAEDGTFTPPS